MRVAIFIHFIRAMKFTRISPSAAVMGVLSLFLLPAARSFSAIVTATTDPVGYAQTVCQASTDTILSIPFTRPAAFVGAIGSISNNVITVASTPGWTASQYKYAQGTQPNTYYAIIGPKFTTIAGTVNATNGSTNINASAGLAGIVAGDEIVINSLAYNVASVTSDTALVLSRAYTGVSYSDQAATYDHSPKEGSYYTVTDNGTNTLTVSLNGDSLATVAAGATVSLIPYWTLGTAFPAANAGTSYIVSTGTALRNYQTQILLPDLSSAGINLPSPVSYFNYNGAWRLGGSDGTAVYDDTILPPTNYFTMRNAVTATTFTPIGGVCMNRLTTVLDTQTSAAQDNAVSVPRPVATALNDLGLITSGAFIASTGTALRSITDSLLVYDNTIAGINKSSSTAYFYYNGAWRLVGSDGTADYGTTTVPYGVGFTIRKAPVTNGLTSFWQSTRNY